MKQILDLTGHRYGSLTVIKYYPRDTKSYNKHWLCRCDCGNLLVVRHDNLRSGHSTKCSECSRNRGHGSVFVKDVVEDGVV